MSTAIAPSPVVRDQPERLRVPGEIFALARFEGRRLLLHPVFLVGVLLSAVSVIAAWSTHEGGAQSLLLSGFALLPLAAATIVATNLAALRGRRDHTDELYASLPRRRSARVAGQLLGLAWTLPVSGALLAAAYLAFGAQHGLVVNYVGLRHTTEVVELLQGPLVVIALGAVGILLARFSGSPILVPLLVVVGFVAVETPFALWSSGQSWVHWLAPMSIDAISDPGSFVPCRAGQPMPVAENDPGCSLVIGFDVAGMVWHVVSLGFMTLLTVAAAVARARRAIAVFIALIGVLTVAGALAAG